MLETRKRERLATNGRTGKRWKQTSVICTLCTMQGTKELARLLILTKKKAKKVLDKWPKMPYNGLVQKDKTKTKESKSKQGKYIKKGSIYNV